MLKVKVPVIFFGTQGSSAGSIATVTSSLLNVGYHFTKAGGLKRLPSTTKNSGDLDIWSWKLHAVQQTSSMSSRIHSGVVSLE